MATQDKKGVRMGGADRLGVEVAVRDQDGLALTVNISGPHVSKLYNELLPPSFDWFYGFNQEPALVHLTIILLVRAYGLPIPVEAHQQAIRLQVDADRAARAASLILDERHDDCFPFFCVTAPLAPNVSRFTAERQGEPEWAYRRIKRFPRHMHLAVAGVMDRLENAGLVPDAYWVGIKLNDRARRVPWPIFCTQFGRCFVGLARWDVVGMTRWG